MRKSPKALSSDAYSGFTKKDSDAASHNADVAAATKELRESVIPRLAIDLPKYVRTLQAEFCLRDLITTLHEQGVNVRARFCPLSNTPIHSGHIDSR